MPFGKFRGFSIQDIPRDYLSWLWENVDLYGRLKDEVSKFILSESHLPELDYLVSDSNRLKRVYREMAFKWHPDRGGTVEAMQAINEFYENLID